MGEYRVESYLMPATREAQLFLESLTQSIHSAEKVYERSILSMILDSLFLLDRERMQEAFKKLITEYSGPIEGALDFLKESVDAQSNDRLISLKLMKAQLMLARGEKKRCAEFLNGVLNAAETEEERFYAIMFLLRVIDDANRAKELLESLNPEKLSNRERALIENEHGKLLWTRDDYTGARIRFENFLRLADDDFLRSIAYNNIGLSLCSMGNYREAMEMFELSLNLCEKLGDRNGSLRTRLNIGEALKEMGLLNDAENMLVSVLNEAKTVNTALGARIRADCCVNLAEIETLRNNFEGALELCEEAGREQCGDDIIEIRIMLVKARCGIAEKLLDEAMSMVKRAIDLAEGLATKRYEASAYLLKGMIHERRSEYKEALQSYGLAIFFFRKINNLYGAANAEERIGRLYESIREGEKAEEHRKRARELLESFRTQR